MNCLVTGASGFIGSWLVRKLLHEGQQVRVLCRTTSQFPLIDDLCFEKSFGDITDPDSIRKGLEGIDTVFHLAGYIGYKKTERELMEKINYEGTKSIYTLSLEKNVKNFIFLSSVTAVGASFSPFQKMNEKSEFNLKEFDFGYAETKRRAEELVLSPNESEMKCVSLNPSTVYGPGDMLKSSRKNQLKAIKGELKFYPYGGVSIVGIHDVVDAIYKSVKLGRHGERYILSGENMFIKELMETICKFSGSTPPKYQIPTFLLTLMGYIGDHLTSGKPIDSETAQVIQMFHWYDNTKAKDNLDFKPTSSDEVIKSSVEWAKKNIL